MAEMQNACNCAQIVHFKYTWKKETNVAYFAFKKKINACNKIFNG